jgi:hypothetical protein
LPVAVAGLGGVYYWSGTIELRADSSFVDVVTLGNAKTPTLAVDSIRGRWQVRGDSVSLTPA